MPTVTIHLPHLKTHLTCYAYRHVELPEHDVPVEHCVWAASHGCDDAPSLLYHQHARSTIPGLQTILPEAITDPC